MSGGAAPAAGPVGEAVARVEDARLVSGGGRYTDDRASPGALHAAFLRSPFAHARIVAIDKGPALAAGAVAVLTGEDLEAAGVKPVPNPTGMGPGYPPVRGEFRENPPWHPLALARVRHVGEAVALVLAETVEAARDAAEHVAVEYDPLPAVTDVDAAAAPGAPAVWDALPGNLLFAVESGDAAATAAAFARAAHVVELELDVPRVAIAFLEPRACLAEIEAGTGRLVVHVGSAGVHLVRERLAAALGLPPDRLRVTTGDVGGGFGARNTTYPEYVACAHGARQLGRPVRWRAERSESFLSDTQARDYRAEGALALDAQGRFLALRVRARGNLGAHLGPRQPSAVIGNLVRLLTGTYAIPAAHLAYRGFVSHTVPVNVYRGVGRTEANYLVERLVDAAARRLGVDRAELRRRNLIPSAAMPWTTPTLAVYDGGDFPATLEAALEAGDWAGFPARRAEAASRGRLRGIGVATILEGAGGPAEEYAEARALPDGTVELATGAQSQGTSHETTLAQVAAELLGLPLHRIRVVAGDTDRVAHGVGSFASRTMIRAGAAAMEAARALIDKGTERAADRLEAAAADLVYRAGRFVVAGTDRSVGLAELAEAAPLAADARHSNEAVAYPNGTHLCELEIDPETGAFRILRYLAVEDVGRAVNPAVVHGQTAGGAAQGLGQVLAERCLFDAETGQPLAASLMEYALPRAADLPSFETHLADVPTLTNPLGVKGAGEAGIVAAPCAAMSALLDALGPLGVAHLDLPATPERVWQAIRAAKSNS